jgi:DNA-binding MarR family transcriptional regulator
VGRTYRFTIYSPLVPSTPIDYWTLAELRYHIRRFLRVREVAVRARGVEPQQYVLLLHVKGLEGRRPATIGTLAERLQITHHSTVELADRLVRRGLLERRTMSPDRRSVVVELTPRGGRLVSSLARQSLSELRVEGPALVVVLRRLIGTRKGAAARMRRRRKAR